MINALDFIFFLREKFPRNFHRLWLDGWAQSSGNFFVVLRLLKGSSKTSWDGYNAMAPNISKYHK